MKKYNFYVKLPCENILDEEEVKEEVEREIKEQLAYGRKVVFIGTLVRGGGELWGHFMTGYSAGRGDYGHDLMVKDANVGMDT